MIYHAGQASEESQLQQGAEPSNISLNKVTRSRFVPMINLVNNGSTLLFFQQSVNRYCEQNLDLTLSLTPPTCGGILHVSCDCVFPSFAARTLSITLKRLAEAY